MCFNAPGQLNADMGRGHWLERDCVRRTSRSEGGGTIEPLEMFWRGVEFGRAAAGLRHCRAP